jgi:hypothetical protein
VVEPETFDAASINISTIVARLTPNSPAIGMEVGFYVHIVPDPEKA